MSTVKGQSSGASTDTETYNERQPNVNQLGRVIGQTRISYGGGNDPKYVKTPLYEELGRATVAGILVEAENSGGSLTAKIECDGHLLRAYANSNSGANPGDIAAIDTPAAVIVTLRPDTYEPEDDDNNRIYSSPNIESIRTTDADLMWANKAEAASEAIKRANELLDKFDTYEETDQSPEPEFKMWNVHHSRSQVEALKEHANAVIDKAIEAVSNTEESTSDGESTSDEESADTGSEESANAEGESESGLQEVLNAHDVYPPAIGTLTTEFDTVDEMLAHGDLDSLDMVGKSTMEDIETIRSA